MKAVFLGNWMANGYRTDDLRKDYEHVEDYIFSQAPIFGLDKFMDRGIRWRSFLSNSGV